MADRQEVVLVPHVQGGRRGSPTMHGVIDWAKNQAYKLATGIDLEQERLRSAQLEQEKARLDAAAIASGRWQYAEIAAASENARREAEGGFGGDYIAQVDAAAVEGAKEGLAAMQSGFKRTLGGVAGGILGFVPWWVWLGAAIYLAFRFGVIRLPK